jgi:hypothetical protein
MIHWVDTKTMRSRTRDALASENEAAPRRSAFLGVIDPRTHEIDSLPVSKRDESRALSRLTSLLRASKVFSTQEVLDFTCAFMDEAVELTSVALIHDRVQHPLVWVAEAAERSTVERAMREVQASYQAMLVAAHDDPRGLFGDEDSSEGAARVITLPLCIPLLGVIRIECARPPRDGDSTFLKHAVILLSLTLDRCADGDCPAPPSSTSPDPAKAPAVFRRGLELSRALAVELARADGANEEVTEAVRLARSMAVNIVDLLETVAPPSR